MKIKAIADIDNIKIPCYGEIEIHWIKEPQAFITWRMFNRGNLIASRSENYFYNKNLDSESQLINKVIRKVENFRIGRNKIFTNVEIIPFVEL